MGSTTAAEQSVPRERNQTATRYRQIRAHSLALAAPLSPEDQCVQSMPDASPTKWHLAHTTWFFETVVLQAGLPAYQPFDPSYNYLFNSYYEALGARHPRPRRGLLTRPSHAEILAYRAHVDEAMDQLIATTDAASWQTLAPAFELGLQHEQQHQELLLTDILHVFSCNPLLPAYQTPAPASIALHSQASWIRGHNGLRDIGHHGEAFAFDNESPRNSVYLAPYEIADRLVTCAEYAAFIADGGYQRPQYWLSDGWALVQAEHWAAPAYWHPQDEAWQVFGLHGLQPLSPAAPVSQLSFYEAAAYADWAGARLPTEFEWEAAASLPGMRQLTGHVWQWTRSSYDPYPGFSPTPGIAAEYNGKFMVGQIVLRGGSLATPPGHTRPTYRNFFPPAARWQFSGLRLARNLA